MGINVLSLFDGMSCGRIALERAGIEVDNYYASEVDKYAIKVSSANYPDIVHLGDVTKLDTSKLPPIDLLIGGSPCQNFSSSGTRKGMITKDNIEILSLEQYLGLKLDGFEFEGQSYLFWEYIRVLEEVKPKFFLLENVVMAKKWENVLTNIMGVQPILINSSLLSAQSRKRMYWTNIPNITQPKDKGILLKDIIEYGESDRDKSLTITTRVAGATKDRYLNKSMHQMIKVGNVNPSGKGMNGNVFSTAGKSPTLTTNKGEGIKITGGAMRGRYLDENGKRLDSTVDSLAGLTEQYIEMREDGKSNCLTTVQKDSLCIQIGVTKNGGYEQNNRLYSIDGKCPSLLSRDYKDPKKIAYNEIDYRKLTVVECCRLQTVPDNYFTGIVSNSQAYKLLGNGWTVDVIVHIFSFMKDGAEPLQRFAKDNNTENELKLTQETLF
jgi:DNA (cytosine-5)-methyltransferase 3A